jgi:hypothetical protein
MNHSTCPAPGMLAALGVLVVGCAGARVQVTAATSSYPLSMSGGVRDLDGKLYARPSLKKVGDFYVEKTRVGILYSAVTPRSFDISDDVNAQVAGVKGEAVINLEVTVSEGCATLNGMPVLNALPIWPGCIPVIITGDIVRRGGSVSP